MSVEFEHLPELEKFYDDAAIDRFHNPDWGEKIVAVMFNCDIQLEEGKTIGKIVLKGDAPKLSLGQYIKFKSEKAKFWGRQIETHQIVVVNAYWCKKYIPELRLSIPIKVWRPQERKFEYEYEIMSKNQFIARRSREFQANWPLKYALGVKNCNDLFHKGRYCAINSTVKHYAVDQTLLERYWGQYNKFLSVLNREWDKLLKQKYEEDLITRKLHGLNLQIKEAEVNEKIFGKVVQFKK